MNTPKVPPPEAPKPDPMAAAQEAVQRAEAAMRARRLNEAVGICQDVLESVPEHPSALALLGSILGHRGETERGMDLLGRACGGYGGNASWFNNLATLARIACRFDIGVPAARRALELAPENTGFRLSLAKLEMDRGEIETAVDGFLDVLARDPENAEAHLALGQIELARGETRSGWYEYEWRNRLEQAHGTLPQMPRPQWNGMRLPGRALLLVGDQGYGDTIQFARLVPRVTERVGQVWLGCTPDLQPLLEKLPGVAGCHHRWQDIPAHAAYCRLSSVPALIGLEMRELPGPMPYLHPDPTLAATWRGRLAERLGTGRPRVGLVWAGRSTHPNDRRRSLRLAQIAPILGQPGVTFVALQKPVPAQDAAELAAHPDVLSLDGELTDFAVTAAVMANLDVVISVDSSAAHLAGAIGCPVWVLTPRPADWRWGNEATTTPWYPTMRLFRQPVAGDWDGAIAAVGWALAGLVQQSGERSAAD